MPERERERAREREREREQAREQRTGIIEETAHCKEEVNGGKMGGRGKECGRS